MAEPRSIRIGLLVAGTSLPRWQAMAIRHLLEMPRVEIVVIGTPARGIGGAGAFGLGHYMETRSLTLLARTVFQQEDMSDPLALVPAVRLNQETLHADIGTLIDHSPDLVFSFLPLLEKAPRSGFPVWQFRFGDQGLQGNGMPGIQAAFSQDNDLLVELGTVDGTQRTSALFPLRVAGGPPAIDPLLNGAAWLPASVISRLRQGSDQSIGSTLIEKSQEIDKQSSIYNKFKSWLNLELHRLGVWKHTDPVKGEWNIGILHQPISTLLDDEHSTNVRWLPAPSEGNHRMEPFGYMVGGQLNVLYRKMRGESAIDSIARLRPKSDSVLKRSRPMLSTTASLQYPFVVERPDGAYTIISYPHQGRTELFRITDQNDGMDHIKVLLNRALSSPSLIYFENRWWLFGTDPEAANIVLLAYHSAEFDGPYTPHELNPLKVAASGSRPAGTLFFRGSELWRPALDTTDRESMSIVLNRVHTLTPTDFLEEAVKKVTGFRGTAYGKGIRTLCAMGDITLIDGLRGTTAENDPGKGHKQGHRKRHKSSGK